MMGMLIGKPFYLRKSKDGRSAGIILRRNQVWWNIFFSPDKIYEVFGLHIDSGEAQRFQLVRVDEKEGK